MSVPRTQNELYKIELKTVEPDCLLAGIENLAWLWHGRLAYVNFRSLKQQVNKKMAVGVPEISHPDQVCSDCVTAKQTRTPFPKVSQWHSTEKLMLVHVDLCGPISPETAGGNKYFMLLVDDHSRWMQAYVAEQGSSL
jgi:hypothetical protein